MRKPGDDWSDDLSAAVRKAYIEEGLSGSQTARLLGQGLTRNSIIAGARQRGWSKGAAGGSMKPKVRVNPFPAEDGEVPDATVAKFNATHPAGPASKLSVDLGQYECQWPVGHEGGRAQLHCGGPVKNRGPYCAEHRGVAYKKGRPVCVS